MTRRLVKCIKTYNKNITEGNTYECIGKWYDADNGEYHYYIVDPTTNRYTDLGEWIDSNYFEILTKETHI